MAGDRGEDKEPRGNEEVFGRHGWLNWTVELYRLRDLAEFHRDRQPDGPRDSAGEAAERKDEDGGVAQPRT